jgi:hypothetical protein
MPRVGSFPLTAVPDRQKFSISRPLFGLIRRRDLPAGFAGSASISFSTCYSLKQPAHRALLKRARQIFLGKVEDRSLLKALASILSDDRRIEEISFQFAYEPKAQVLVLNAVARPGDGSKLSAQVLLHDYSTEGLAPFAIPKG